MINVLSLFDGMSCGQIALERASIEVENYFSSEIDKFAMKVTNANYPNTIQLGDVRSIDLESLPSIDLLIGGSPCQGFSFIGKQLNFEDERSALFFEYVRILKEVKPKYFLLENVVMKKEYQDVISSYLGAEPIKINSSLVSAQNRLRLYWTNIPMDSLPIDKGLVIKDVIDCNFSEQYPNYLDLMWGVQTRKSKVALDTEKARCLTASMYRGQINSFCKNEDGLVYKYAPEDCEILQTVPIGYTNHASKSQRYKMLGNGWTVDVIAHIFSFMEF